MFILDIYIYIISIRYIPISVFRYSMFRWMSMDVSIYTDIGVSVYDVSMDVDGCSIYIYIDVSTYLYRCFDIRIVASIHVSVFRYFCGLIRYTSMPMFR